MPNFQSFTIDFLTRYFQQITVYLIATVLVYSVFYIILKKKFLRRYIGRHFPDQNKIKFEIFHSLISRIIFSILIVIVAYSSSLGQTKIYTEINQYGLGWFFLSGIILILWHDTYFYWVHRLFHNIHFFKYIHHLHHRSSNPTPFASNSFDPIEAFLEALPIVIAIYVIPLHPAIILFWDVFQFGVNIYGHLGFEMLSSCFTKHWFWGWFNSSTHHNMHHTHFNTNFGLYFNFWDRVMGTNHPDYHNTFESIHERALDYQI